jgi:hypothetical protein
VGVLLGGWRRCGGRLALPDPGGSRAGGAREGALGGCGGGSLGGGGRERAEGEPRGDALAVAVGGLGARKPEAEREARRRRRRGRGSRRRRRGGEANVVVGIEGRRHWGEFAGEGRRDSGRGILVAEVGVVSPPFVLR